MASIISRSDRFSLCIDLLHNKYILYFQDSWSLNLTVFTTPFLLFQYNLYMILFFILYLLLLFYRLRYMVFKGFKNIINCHYAL